MTGVELEHLVQRAAEAAAECAVYKTFRLLGVDLADTASVNELRTDLIYTRRARKRVERLSFAGLVALVSAAALGAATLLWDGVRRALGGE